MKTFFITLVAVGCLALAAQARQDSHHGKSVHEAAPAAAGEVIKRGAPLGKSETVAFSDVLKEPQKYAGRVVRIEGVVEKVCKAEGCWMEISPAAGAESIRVTFKNHGFFVPKDSKSMKFRAEGEFGVKVLSKEQVDHLVNDDGATIRRNDDGTANEVTFVATGVELWK
jgi:hypothetical protein